MRPSIVLLALALAAGPAAAQTPLTGTTGVPAGSPALTPGTTAPDTPVRRRATLQERFDEANTTHDGHLTLEQARSKMPAVAHRFAEIDTANQGYVTLEQIQAYQRQQRAERRAEQKATRVAQ